MSFARVLLPFCALLLVAAAPAPQADAPCRPRMGMGLFTPEQRLVMLRDAQAATADGSIAMKDYRAMQRDKIKAMSAEQRQTYFADLSKRWAALAPVEQAKLKAKAEAMRQKREAKMGANCPPPQG